MRGDIASFGKLCDRYYSSMLAIGYSVLLDHHLAEDAAQEAFARALRNLAKLKSKDKFGPWLGRICRNAATDMVRKNSRMKPTEDLSAVAQEPGDAHESQAVRQAIGKLKVSDRELIVLRYYDNMSHEKMSSVLGISKAAINNRLFRVRRRLAKHLQGNGFAEVEL